jgi:hypothetical protein
MLEEMNWKKFLTENVLGECWDADKRPGGDLPNRTFDNRDDLLDLYKAIDKNEKWAVFIVYSNSVWWRNHDRRYDLAGELMADYNSWLFCLGDEDYAAKCKLVAEFHGWKEEKLKKT